MIRVFILDRLILLTKVKILESTHLCYHEVISVVITNCCRKLMVRNLVMAYMYCISQLVRIIIFIWVGVVSYKMFSLVVTCKKEDGRETIVDQ